MKKSIKSLLVATSAMICLSGCGSIDEGSILPVVEAEEVTTTATEVGTVETKAEEPTVKVETETTMKAVEVEATTKATTGTTKKVEKVTTDEKVTKATEKATMAKANSKTMNRVTTQPTTSRVTTAVTQPTTAKRVTEKATTARKVTQTVTKPTQKVTQKATEKATKKPVQQTTKKPTEKSTTQAKKGYSYKAYVLNEECLTNSVIAIYIKTDNPNGMWDKKGSVIIENEKTEDGLSFFNAMDYKDVRNISVTSLYTRVDGGYLVSLSFDKPGTYKILVKETVGDEYYCYNNTTKVTLKVTVKDYKTEEAKWVKSVIRELSPKLKNLSAKGKIDYLNNWINANFKYKLNDGNLNPVYLLSETIKPYWQSKRGTCINFTNILCMLAKELGYNAKGEAAGYLQHEYAIVYIDGEWVEYPEQPGSEENVFNPKTVKYWDFSQYK